MFSHFRSLALSALLAITQAAPALSQSSMVINGIEYSVSGARNTAMTTLSDGVELGLDGTKVRIVNGKISVDGTPVSAPPAKSYGVSVENGVLVIRGDGAVLYSAASAASGGSGSVQAGSTGGNTQTGDPLETAAATGDPRAINDLAAALYRGDGRPQDLPRAADLFMKAAAAGDSYAMTNAGIAFEYGKGVAPDLTRALDYYIKAADAGRMDAAGRAALLLRLGGEGLAPDKARAVKMARRAAEGGDRRGLQVLGVVSFFGEGGQPKDRTEAARWFFQAANAGDGRSAMNLGIMYRDGEGLPKDLFQARHWFETAVRLGENSAQKDLDKLAAQEQ